MRRLTALLFLGAAPLYCQINSGELRMRVTDPSGRGVKVNFHLLSEANHYSSTLATDQEGDLDVQRLAYGVYRLDMWQPGFSPVSQILAVRSAFPVDDTIVLKLPTVAEMVTVNAANTLIDFGQVGSVDQIGSTTLQHRVSSIPGRSLQDLVNSQPGWLYEGNAVLHPRGSEYQTQFVVDGIPLTDNRSPSFGPEIGADDVTSMSIYTAGFPAEYGRELGGVIELNTAQELQPGFHGTVVLSGGSFDSGSASSRGQYSWGRSSVEGSATGSMTAHYLNPVVPENYSNRATLGDFAVRYQRGLSAKDRLDLNVRHSLSRYDIPNEQVQESVGQRQTADNIETMGSASFEHVFSSRALADLRAMARDNANDFRSNPQSTPITIFQQNQFREVYFKASTTVNRGANEFKSGVESDSKFLHENFHYEITDPSQFDGGTARIFAFAAQRPDLEQGVFAEDQVRLKQWTISAGIRWDHYQLLLNRESFSPRFSLSRYFSSANLVMHFSYDRVFQTPSFQNILLSSSTAVESVNPSSFLRLPVQPSVGDFYEGGLTKTLLGKVRLDVNGYRRFVGNYADDDQIRNTGISFPIALRKAIVYGAEGKIDVPDWHHFSGSLSYSYMVGNAWYPVTGGLFLGADVGVAEAQRSGHFPDSQDQRNTVRSRARYQITRRLWVAAGIQYDTGLPFEFDGEPSTVLAEYGQQVLNHVNFNRGRIYPSFQVSSSAGIDLTKRDQFNMQLQADGQNLTDTLDLIDFGGLFSGNAIGPSRSVMLRLTASF